ncbi:lachesin [Eurytemora carolleeae]|uniref:lachesin n=1 Tax=Eurytemora carolleeae TaxID=1294199 RepID=UPI000C780293|nr:lachesin [Eurytemora carolleeae]|eukprot:XP_023322130.1 lachesin-like [Eurytemora affinis]
MFSPRINWILFSSVFFKIGECIAGDDEERLPILTEEVTNLTVVAGREAILSCHVSHLGSYKVAWVRVDTQTILTIHNSIITRNQRVSLSHREHKEWKLHISNIQESDRGWYMCQVNTDPMRSKRGYLEVTVPPSILDARSSTDLVVKEKDRVNLTCEARGYPEPQVLWRREDGEIILSSEKGKTISGGSLLFERVGREHIGTYLCIASNGVPPSVSKRVQLRVQFPPMMTVPSQLERSRIGGNVSLRYRCYATLHAIPYP